MPVDAVPPGPLQVVLLAVVQGLTEFLPVSSSGHLVLTEEALGVTASGLVLPVALHLGTLVAVVLVYRDTLLGMLRDLLRGRPAYSLLVVLGSVPAGVVGVLLESWFEERFGDPRSAAVALLFTALILVGGDLARRRRMAPPGPRGSLNVLDAISIGLAQAVAILPGISRSGSTISAGLARGLVPAEAARFSFVLSVVAIGGAAVLEARGLLHGEDPLAPGVPVVVLGVVVSALVGWASLRLLLAFLNRGAFLWFAAYCAVLGTSYLLLS